MMAYYSDEFDDYQDVYFKKDSISGRYFPASIKSKYPIWLRFTKGAQIPVYVIAGDTVIMNRVTSDQPYYTFKLTRPGEFGFYSLLNKKYLGMNAGDLSGIHNEEKIFRPRTKMLNYLYNERRALLERVKDSLALGPGFYNFIKTEITSTYLTALLAPYYLTPFNRQPLRKTYLDTLSNFYHTGFFTQDSLVFCSPHYRNCITFYNRFLSRQALQMPQEMEVLYQTAKSKFSGRVRDYALFSLLKENLPKNLGMEKYLAQYRTDITYQPYSRYLDSIANRPKTLVSDWAIAASYLESYQGKQITWQKLLEENKGKVMYVNFWASWFDPEILQIAPSIKLVNQFKDSNIVFVFIAVEFPDYKQKWKEAISVYGLNKSGLQHFKIEGKSRLTEFISGIPEGLSMPHYLLVDASGKVAAMDAKSPEDFQLRADILKLLKTNK
ncbi:hypothetical protein AHMF7605_28325 [Adhaeribacter arboris]|uniref:Thioredoxin domain-containing protein n=2 Tax=Adhaeribacter arboris TaxID=2072846 RepID=A0A2T2YNN5_9BACT|nr:hypothetical protein AHMF7605_28325 [Adhaeribacter arboris]